MKTECETCGKTIDISCERNLPDEQRSMIKVCSIECAKNKDFPQSWSIGVF